MPELPNKVPARFDKAAVVLRNVAGHSWGWFSREDQRMHLQTVERGGREGPDSAKVWLEERGKRVCLPAGEFDLEKLTQKVNAERQNIESRWISFMIENDWLRAELCGRNVVLTVYPSSHNSFTRMIDLQVEFPGVYRNDTPRSWDVEIPLLFLDHTVAALAIGTEKQPDDRNHIDLTKWVFED